MAELRIGEQGFPVSQQQKGLSASIQTLHERISLVEGLLRVVVAHLARLGVVTGAPRVLSPDVLPGMERLTPREQQVLTALLAGQRVPSIARALGISPNTVRNHLKSIFHKLHVHSQAQLLDCLLPPDPIRAR